MFVENLFREYMVRTRKTYTLNSYHVIDTVKHMVFNFLK